MNGLSGGYALLPRPAGPVRLERIGLDGLMALRARQDAEGFGALTCRPLRTRTETEKRALYRAALDNPDMLLCGICLPGRAEPVGKLTASDFNPRNRSAELGYYLVPEFRGRGYMRAALLAFCGLLLEGLGLNKVYAQTGSFNAPSAALLEACGFRRDGVLREHHEQDGALLRTAPPKVAYAALERLMAAAETSGEVCRYFDDYAAMLDDSGSYVRTRGLVMIARAARWDGAGRVEAVLDRYLEHITDPKPITARRCIQELRHLLSAKPEWAGRAREALQSADCARYPDSMRGLIQRDILELLAWMDQNIEQ